MPRVCAVLNCHNNSGRDKVDRHGLPINYFSWPCPEKLPDRFSAFSRLCCLDMSTCLANKQKIICSSHFVSKDITGNREMKAVLNPFALPSLNLPTAEQVTDFLSDVIQADSGEPCDSSSFVACSVELSTEVSFSRAFDDVSPTLTLFQVASSVNLPNENWYKRYETSSLHFFEIDVLCYARPVVFRSVTFHGDLSDPVIYINGVREVVPCSLISVDDVSKLLRSVCAMQPSVLSHLACAVASLDRVLSLENATSTCDSTAGSCSQQSNDTGANVLPDHTYTASGQMSKPMKAYER